MKRKFILASVLTLCMLPMCVEAQREQKPVTAASLIRSLMTLSDKASKAGRDKDAAIILQAAGRIMAEASK